jgi:uncharacterized repeat protein (TIGR03806 family)
MKRLGFFIALTQFFLAAGVLRADIGPSGLDTRPANTTCVAPARPTGAATVAIQEAAPGLGTFNGVVGMAQAPGDASRWYVLERAGRVRVFSTTNPGAVSTWLDISAEVNSNVEGGLLGIAFHPNFPATREVFLYYTAPGAPMISRVSRFILDNVTAPVNVTEQIIISINQPFENHNGGEIEFGPDGFLYLGLGDGGGGGDPFGNAQNLTSLLGKMLRINVLGVPWPTPGYSIPPDNPFATNARCGPATNANSCPEIYAWGFRNPYRWSFDTQTGQLWVGDVGESAWEELDIVELGGNYGWHCREGKHAFDNTGCPANGFIDPILEYPHDASGDLVIIGGVVYRGNALPALRGRYIFGDFSSGRIWALKDDGAGGYTQEELINTPDGISRFALGNDGELYYAENSGGHLRKIIPAGAPVPDTIPSTLTASGCVNAAAPQQPAAGVVPFQVNSPLWSDGASKSRFLAIPDGTTIALDTAGDLQFPPGTILMKSFQLAGLPVETRLFMRHPDGVWAGYTYEWNAAATEATRVVGGKTKLVGGQLWNFPSESECMRCHTAAAGYALGPEVGQLNGNLLYPLTGRTANQLATLDHIGMFTNPMTVPAESQFRLPDPSKGNAFSIAARARAYLHANCSGCHRPSGPTPSSMDLRYSATITTMNACNAVPQSGNLGLSNPRLIKPGDSANSVLIARMAARNASGMPPIASAVIDTTGVALIAQWINGLQNCSVADVDGDGVDDTIDNCRNTANANQRDTDDDGYGSVCDPDFNNDGAVNINDWNRLKARLNVTPVVDVATDLDGNGAVNINDLNRLKSYLGKPPGPSAVHP